MREAVFVPVYISYTFVRGGGGGGGDAIFKMTS